VETGFQINIMKQILSVLILLLTASACTSKRESKEPVYQAGDSTIYYPYSPVYASEFEPGRSLYAKMVLDIWKQYETGDVTHSAKSFSDSVLIILPDKTFRGRRDSALSFLKKRRQVYVEVQCFIDAWMPVHVKDVGDDLVFLWGRQDCTAKNGKRDYLVVHEIWRFDKKGKIRSLQQYYTRPD
jgi:hypothetical protein